MNHGPAQGFCTSTPTPAPTPRHEVFLQAARQTAINLTTIDFNQVDADVKRILDSATGQFYDDFSQRAQPFIEVVKQAQSKSTGSVTAVALESSTEHGAQVLVAVSVKTASAVVPTTHRGPGGCA